MSCWPIIIHFRKLFFCLLKAKTVTEIVTDNKIYVK